MITFCDILADHVSSHNKLLSLDAGISSSIRFFVHQNEKTNSYRRNLPRQGTTLWISLIG